ncbi:MAG: hypothetical protein ACLFPS_09395 [Clostridia bacterium]
MNQTQYAKKVLLYGPNFIKIYNDRERRYQRALDYFNYIKSKIYTIHPKQLVSELEKCNRHLRHEQNWHTHEKLIFGDQEKFISLYYELSEILKDEAKKRPYINPKSKKGKEIERKKKAKERRGKSKSKDR